jgi:pimeloyl-ACP methyl ester carboxylesterase
VPGLADDARSFLLVAAHLAEHFRCIAYDLPAGGSDGACLRRYSHADLVADLVALLDQLGIRQSYVFGSSFGSTIALAALRLCPERLPRAVLQGGFACRPLAFAEVSLARLARYWPGRMGLLPFRTAILRYNHHAPFARQPPEVWEYFLTRSNLPPMAAVAHRALLLHHSDLRPILAEIRQPLLLVSGSADPLVKPHCTEALLQGLPNAGHIDLPGCGHNPLFTHPDVLADIVHRFLTPPTCNR